MRGAPSFAESKCRDGSDTWRLPAGLQLTRRASLPAFLSGRAGWSGYGVQRERKRGAGYRSVTWGRRPAAGARHSAASNPADHPRRLPAGCPASRALRSWGRQPEPEVQLESGSAQVQRPPSAQGRAPGSQGQDARSLRGPAGWRHPRASCWPGPACAPMPESRPPVLGL